MVLSSRVASFYLTRRTWGILVMLVSLLICYDGFLPSFDLRHGVGTLARGPEIFLGGRRVVTTVVRKVPLHRLLDFIPKVGEGVLRRVINTLGRNITCGGGGMSVRVGTLYRAEG